MNSPPFPADHDLLTLTVLSEAASEPVDGMAAVVRVIQNRTRLKYQSDGTLRGTILHPSAFSEFGFDWIAATGTTKGHYVKSADAYTPERVARMMKGAQAQRIWAKCASVVGAVTSGCYVGDVAYDHLTDSAVMYANLAILHPPPEWATPAKLVTVIGHHSFYRA